MLGQPSEIVGIDVNDVRPGGKQVTVVAARARFHRGDELARDLRRLEIARERFCKRALDKRRARLLDPCKPTHRKRMPPLPVLESRDIKPVAPFDSRRNQHVTSAVRNGSYAAGMSPRSKLFPAKNHSTTSIVSRGSVEHTAYTSAPPAMHRTGRSVRGSALASRSSVRRRPAASSSALRGAAHDADSRAGRIDQHAVEALRRRQQILRRIAGDHVPRRSPACSRRRWRIAPLRSSRSMQSSVPSPAMRAPICSALFPRPLQTSRTASPGCGFRMSTGIAELSDCIHQAPAASCS